MVQMYRQPLNLSLPKWLLPQNWSTVDDLANVSGQFVELVAQFWAFVFGSLLLLCGLLVTARKAPEDLYRMPDRPGRLASIVLIIVAIFLVIGWAGTCPSASSGFADSCAVSLAPTACTSAITIATVAFATVSTIGAAALAAIAFIIATVALLVELAVHYVIVMPLVWLAGPWVLDELSAVFAFTISTVVLDATVALAGVAITAASVALAFTMTSVTGPFSFNVMLLALYILIYYVNDAFSRFKTFLLGGKTQDGKPVESVPNRMLSNIFYCAFEWVERHSINMVTAPVTAPPLAATPAPAAGAS
jgi:hypothetical protein